MSKELDELIQSGRKSMEGASPEARTRVTARIASSTGAILAVTGAAASAGASAAGTAASGFAMTGAVKVAVAGVLAICAVGTGYVVTSSSVSTSDSATETAVDSGEHTEEALEGHSIEPTVAPLVYEPPIEDVLPPIAPSETEEEEPVAISASTSASNDRRPIMRREAEVEVAAEVEANEMQALEEPPSLRGALSALRAAGDALSRHDASEAISILSSTEIPASLVEQREGLLTIARCRLSPSRRRELRDAFESTYSRSLIGPRVRTECQEESNNRTVDDSITE
jgi:hypothetical protein